MDDFQALDTNIIAFVLDVSFMGGFEESHDLFGIYAEVLECKCSSLFPFTFSLRKKQV